LLEPLVTVAVPTLGGSAPLEECLDALERQTLAGADVVVIDNSGAQRVALRAGIRIIRNDRNVGYGAAANQAWLSSNSPYCAVINDDAMAAPGWLAALVAALEAHPRAGMAASQVRLADTGLLDSAGMVIARDGSSKQRAHREVESPAAGEVLIPSGSAAMFRREVIDQTGGFDPDFFLYCEDTDLGLRAQQLGWRCIYVPEAAVEHRYSATAGAASPLKAYLVERNRLRLVVRNFPYSWLWRVPFYSAARYWHHFQGMRRGEGKAAAFAASGQPAWKLAWYVVKAHLALLAELRRLLRERSPVPAALLERWSIPVKEVAAH